MMLANDEYFAKDFANRTRSNYQRHKQFTEYEVTFLINSAVGMLIVPKEKYQEKISDDQLEPELLKKLKSCVTENSYSQKISLKFMTRHMRNAIAHGHIEFEAEKQPQNGKPLKIHKVTFRDSSDYGSCVITMSVELLEEFFLAFSEAITKL